jgi:hypothetical protein
LARATRGGRPRGGRRSENGRGCAAGCPTSAPGTLPAQSERTCIHSTRSRLVIATGARDKAAGPACGKRPHLTSAGDSLWPKLVTHLGLVRPPSLMRLSSEPLGIAVGLIDAPVAVSHFDLEAIPARSGSRGRLRAGDECGISTWEICRGHLMRQRGSIAPAVCPDSSSFRFAEAVTGYLDRSALTLKNSLPRFSHV